MNIENFIDIRAIVQISIFMVGLTQLAKQFLEIKRRRLKIAVTVAVGLAGGLLLHYLPPWIFTMLLGISTGVIFYDYILKILEKFFRGAEQ
mgnify:CR=1 FL=1